MVETSTGGYQEATLGSKKASKDAFFIFKPYYVPELSLGVVLFTPPGKFLKIK